MTGLTAQARSGLSMVRQHATSGYTGVVSVALVRGIVTFLMVVVVGLPVGILCARECSSAASARAQGANASHCHETESAATTSIGPAAPESCAGFILADPATRDRHTTADRPLPALVASQLPNPPAPLHRLLRHDFLAWTSGGLSPGTTRPLRI
jgi:hypothetical protein